MEIALVLGGAVIGSMITIACLAVCRSSRENEIYMDGYITGRKERANETNSKK